MRSSFSVKIWMCIPKLHQLTRVEVVSLLGAIYEHSAWVAEALLDQGLTEDDTNISISPIKISTFDKANLKAVDTWLGKF